MMKLLKTALVTGSLLLLTACGEAYDGTYNLLSEDGGEIELSGSSAEFTPAKGGKSIDFDISEYESDEEGNPISFTMSMGSKFSGKAEFLNNDLFGSGRDLYIRDDANLFAAVPQFKGTYTVDTGNTLAKIVIGDNSIKVVETFYESSKTKVVINETFGGLVKVVKNGKGALMLLSKGNGLLPQLPMIGLTADQQLEFRGRVFVNQDKKPT
jgi:hypothetical protein